MDNCAEAIVLAGLQDGINGQVFNILDDDLPASSQFLRRYKQEVRPFLSVPVPYPAWRLFCRLWEQYSRWSGGQLPPVFNRRSCQVYWKGTEVFLTETLAGEIVGFEPVDDHHWSVYFGPMKLAVFDSARCCVIPLTKSRRR